MRHRLLSAFWFRLLIAPGLLYLIVFLPANAAPLPDTATPQGVLTGTVTDQKTGAPLQRVNVSACQWRDGQCPWLTSSYTDAEGRYQVPGLAEGEYRVCFSADGYVEECYDDWPFPTQGTRIVVGPGQTVTGVDAALAPKSRIRGLVTDRDTGRPIADVRVTGMIWYYSYWAEIANATTDGSGHYDLNNLNAGAYRLRFLDNGGAHAERFYKTGRAVGSAESVGVGTGQVVDGIDMALPRLGGLSGRVQSLSTGEPLQGITVTLSGWPPIEPVVTDRLGWYELPRLTEGEYTVEYSDPTHAYAHCFYSGVEGSCEAKPVQVVDGQMTEGINQRLPETGGVRGTVVDAVTREPVQGIDVAIVQDWMENIPTGTTDLNGQFEVRGLDPGEHQVAISDPAGRYPQLYSDTAGVVVIESGRMTEKRWELHLIKVGARTVRGRVTDAASGAALPAIQVILQDETCHWRDGCSWHEVASVLTGGDGTYEFVDPPNVPRLVTADPVGVYLQEISATYHYPEPGETVVADLALRTVASVYGRFTGRVTNASGAPVGDLWVYTLRQDAQGNELVWVNPNGKYAILALSGVYKLQFVPHDPYVGEYYDDAPTAETAQMLTIRAGEVITANATLTMLGRFTGRVTDEAGNPLPGAGVWFYKVPSLSYFTGAATDAEGRYSSPYLADGAYWAYFTAASRDHFVWGGGHDVAAGARIEVRAGQVIEGIDAALGPIGALAGRVTDRLTGEPLVGIRVGTGGYGEGTTGSDGTFVIRELPSRSYQVMFWDPGGKYPQQNYTDGSGGPHDSYVAVSAPFTTTIAMSLALPGHAVGRVTDIRGAPIPRSEVKFRQSCCWERVVKTDENGEYDSGPLLGHNNMDVDWQYTLSFADPTGQHQPEYHDDAKDEGAAKLVWVRPGQTVVADAVLDASGQVTGTVTNSVTGEPLSGVKAWIQISKYTVREVATDGNGAYLLDALPPGPTTLNFGDCCRRYVPLSRPVTITLNTTLAGQDVALAPWGRLSGQVTDERTGAGIPKAWVTLYRANGASWLRAGALVTGAEGRYAFAGLDSGAYRIEFLHPRGWYRSEIYSDAQSLEQGADVRFTVGQDTPEIDAALTPTGDAPPPPEQRVYLPLVVK